MHIIQAVVQKRMPIGQKHPTEVDKCIHPLQSNQFPERATHHRQSPPTSARILKYELRTPSVRYLSTICVQLHKSLSIITKAECLSRKHIVHLQVSVPIPGPEFSQM